MSIGAGSYLSGHRADIPQEGGSDFPREREKLIPIGPSARTTLILPIGQPLADFEMDPCSRGRPL